MECLNGVSGVVPITLFEVQDYQVKIAAEVKNFKPDRYMSDKDARRRDRYQNFALAAARSAVSQAGLVDEKNLSSILKELVSLSHRLLVD